MIDIQAGDVVVRIILPGDEGLPDHLLAPPLGIPVRVAAVCPPDIDGVIGLIIEGYPSGEWFNAWSAQEYRKLDKATDKFTTQIKAIRPIKQREKA